MKSHRLLVFLMLVGWSADEAFGQYGLYASPEPVRLPVMQPGGYGAQMTSYTPGAALPPAPSIPGEAGMMSPQMAYGAPVATPPLPRPAVAPQAGPGSRLPVAQPVPPVPVSPSPSNVVPWNQPATTPRPDYGPALGTPTYAPQPAGGCGYFGEGGCDAPQAGCAAPSLCCGETACSPWYVTVLALGMTRNSPNMLWTTAQVDYPENQWGWNHYNWEPGGEIRVGRWFCCNQWAVEASYWTLNEFYSKGQPNATMDAPYLTPMRMSLVDLLGTTDPHGNVTKANEWFDASPEHCVDRWSEVQNLEFNLIRGQLCGGPCQCWNIDVLAGIRWFHFHDRLSFSAQHGPYDVDGNPTSPYQGNWIQLDDEVTNDLIGPQLGFQGEWRFASRWKLFATPKFGIYYNHITLDYDLYALGANGQFYQGTSPTYRPGVDYPIHRSTDVASLMAQLDIGLSWQITPHWEILGGYRVMSVSSIGLADNQVPFYGNDTQAIAHIQRNGSLVLHGAFAGLTFRF